MGTKAKFKFEPDYAVPPGETLQETLDHLGMSQAELAQRTGKTPKHINEIVKGKSPIVPETALEFERVLGVPASFWNNLEKNYREALARIEETKKLGKAVSWLEKFPLSDLRKWKILSKGAGVSKLQNVSEMLNFFGLSSPDCWEGIWEGPQAAFRQSPVFRHSPQSVSAWLRLGELMAQKIRCKPFDKEEFKRSLDAIRHELILDSIENSWPKIVEVCAKAGVAVVCVPELNKTHASGATHWLNAKKAVIQLSLRGKSDDLFWFTFFHEAGHICLHGKKEGYIEDGATGGEKEKEADNFAANYLINKSEYRRFLDKDDRRKSSIIEFAKQSGLPPGIVVGRLQHEKRILRMVHNDLKVKISPEAISSDPV